MSDHILDTSSHRTSARYNKSFVVQSDGDLESDNDYLGSTLGHTSRIIIINMHLVSFEWWLPY